MAVVVGTAQGKLTLDASKFITNIDSSYKALKKFNDLIADTQKALNNLPNKTIELNATGSTGLIPGGGSGVVTPELENPDPNDYLGETTKRVDKLKDALNVGLTGALKGVSKLAEITFAGFKKYTEFVISFSKDSLQVGQQFDATMSQVGAISGATGEDFDALREKALEMGAATKFSASEAGQALVYMGMAGWKTEDMLEGIEGIMSLSAASGEDLATTSDIVTDALTAFGLEAKDAAHFSDVLAAASTNSNTNVALMGETFKYVAPLAGTMKFSVEDAAVAIGTMANSGIKGSQAGTALRSMITNLVKPSKKMAEAMDAFGISMSDSEGNALDLMQTMQMLRTRMKEIPEVTGEEAEALHMATGEIETYNDHYKTYLEKFGGDEDAAKAAYDRNVAIVTEIGEKYGLAYHEIYRMSDYLGASLEQTQAAVAATIAGKFGLSGMLAIVNASDEDFQSLTESIYGASEGMGAANEMSEKMMDNLTGSVTIFKSTLETFKITISDLMKGPANDLVKFGQKAVADMTTAMQKEGIPGLIRAIGQIIPKAAAEIVKYIPVVLPSLIDGFWALVNGVIKAIPDALPTIIDGAMQLVMGLAQGITDASSNLLPLIPEIVNKLCSTIDDNADSFIKAGFDLLLNLMEGIAKALPEIIKTVVKLVRTFIGNLKDYLPHIIEAGIDIILALIDGLTDPETIEAFIETIGDIISIMIDTLGKVDWLETADKIFSGIGKALQGIFEGALGAIDKLLGTNLKGWAQEVGKFMDYLKAQSFEFGKSLANAMNKTEIELNELHGKYSETYNQMLDYYAEMVKAGTNSQEAMAAAYQKYFQSAEAQYVFRERFASAFGQNNALAEQLGTAGMSNQQIVDLLSRASATSGNTYNFYTNEPIDEKKAADEIRKTNEDLLMGR